MKLADKPRVWRHKKILAWLYVICWLGVIFYFSSQPDLKSSLPTTWDFIFRKIAHISEYFVLAFLFFKAVSNYSLSSHKKIILTLFFPILIAVFDEYYQTTVPGRGGSFRDVFIDAVGALIVVYLIKYYNYNNKIEVNFDFF